jgi:starch synthase
VAEVVEDGVTGLLVPPEQPRAMADAVLRLLGDERPLEWMSVAGRETAIQRFDADRVADVYVQAYEAALAYRAARRSSA